MMGNNDDNDFSLMIMGINDRTGIRCVRWTAEGKYLAVCSEDGNISIVGVTSGSVKACFPIEKNSYVRIFMNSPLSGCRCLRITQKIPLQLL